MIKEQAKMIQGINIKKFAFTSTFSRCEWTLNLDMIGNLRGFSSLNVESGSGCAAVSMSLTILSVKICRKTKQTVVHILRPCTALKFVQLITI